MSLISLIVQHWVIVSVIVLCIFIFLLFLFNVIYIVEQQTIFIIERFGKYVDSPGPGLHIKLPSPISIIASRVSLKIIQQEHKLGIKTADNAFIQLPVKVQFRVIADKVYSAVYQLDNPQEQINSFVLNIIRAKAATLTLEEIYVKKNEISEYVKESLTAKMLSYGYEIIEILVDEPEPSNEVQLAYNSVIASKRELDAARNQAESKKVLLIGEAEAEARSLELKAESYAKQRKIIAKGIASALDEVVDGEITPLSVLKFISGIDYRDTIRDAAKSDSNTLIFSNNSNDADINEIKKILPLMKSMSVDPKNTH